jgi:GNAT superfamily N-acetyltransferase
MASKYAREYSRSLQTQTMAKHAVVLLDAVAEIQALFKLPSTPRRAAKLDDLALSIARRSPRPIAHLAIMLVAARIRRRGVAAALIDLEIAIEELAAKS